jgi:hypothetical protein
MILIFSAMLLLATTNFASAQEDTCLWQGQTFQRGESLGNSFETLCGSPVEYPCYCNPDFNPPIECPYCGFAQPGGDILCAADDEIVTYTDLAGVEKICECSAPIGGTPTPNCNLPAPGATCTIDLPGGTSRTFEEGASIGDFLPNRCGSEFPCFCNPVVEGQIECPYCRFASLGGNLACAGDGETVSFQDILGNSKTCSCQIPNDPTAELIGDCNASPPASAPVATAPTTSAPVQTPSLPNDSQTDVCTLEMPSGQIVTFLDGESYGEYLPTRCGSTEDFPCFCNTALPNKVECPYCGFVGGSGSLVCSKDGETVSFQDGSITRTCSCEIPDDPSQQPIRTCGVEPTLPANVCSVLTASGDEVIIQDLESFGTLIDGECGPPEDWPAFCDASIDQVISRQAPTPATGNIVYPYCIFEDTEDGSPICARSNGDVTYVNDIGVEVTCGCLFLSPALGGAQSSCSDTGSGGTVTTAPVGDSSPTEAPVQDRPDPSDDESSATSLSIWSTLVAVSAAFLFFDTIV